jgi:hypothetical protein
MEPKPPTARIQSAAVVVPLAGLLLLMPPFISLFAAPISLFGIPLVVLYMFGVWAALVLLTRWLARRLAAGGDSPPPA